MDADHDRNADVHTNTIEGVSSLLKLVGAENLPYEQLISPAN